VTAILSREWSASLSENRAVELEPLKARETVLRDRQRSRLDLCLRAAAMTCVQFNLASVRDVRVICHLLKVFHQLHNSLERWFGKLNEYLR
jgi:hypothetical protein